jgi:hypothetical protein
MGAVQTILLCTGAPHLPPRLARVLLVPVLMQPSPTVATVYQSDAD